MAPGARGWHDEAPAPEEPGRAQSVSWSELSADVDEPVHPRDPATGEDGGTERDQHADAPLGRCRVVPGARGDGPDHRR